MNLSNHEGNHYSTYEDQALWFNESRNTATIWTTMAPQWANSLNRMHMAFIYAEFSNILDLVSKVEVIIGVLDPQRVRYQKRSYLSIWGP